MQRALSRPAPWIVAAGVAAGLFGVSGHSFAQSRYTAPRAQYDEPDVPNVPDRNGCVKQCDLDDLPCDPPLYKKLDGRCTLKD